MLRIKINLLVLIILGLSLFSCNHVWAATADDPLITLTSPKGGETFSVGSSMTITWNQTNVDTVWIGYKSCPSCLDWIVANHKVDLSATTGSYTWTIPSHITPGNNYQIDITGYHTNFGSKVDVSNYFNITAAANTESDKGLGNNNSGVSDLPQADAYKAIVKVKTFGIDQYNNLSYYGYGSGVIITAGGLILTNHHVVTITDSFDGSDESAAYQICLPTTIGLEPSCHYLAKLVAKNKDLDIALLQIQNIEGLGNITTFPYLNLNQDDTVQVNDSVFAIGYPEIGGETVTITKGIISGQADKYNLKWFKTDAVTSFGSSGGAVINVNNKVVGITTEAHADVLGTLGYIINVANLNNWLSNNKGLAPQTNALLERLQSFSLKQNNLSKSNYFANNYFSIIKPSAWSFSYDSEDVLELDNQSESEGGLVSVFILKRPKIVELNEIMPIIKDFYGELGTLPLMSFNESPLNQNGLIGKKINISVVGDSFYSWAIPYQNNLIFIQYHYGADESDKEVVDAALNSFKLSATKPQFNELKEYSNSNLSIYVKAIKNWSFLPLNDKSTIVEAVNKLWPEAFIEIKISKITENVKNMNNNQYLDYLKQQIKELNKVIGTLDLKAEVGKSNAHYKISNELADVIMIETVAKNISSGDILAQAITYNFKKGDKMITISMDLYSNDITKFTKAKQEFLNFAKAVSLKSSGSKINAKLSQRLAGKFLLAVNSGGNIWYVSLSDNKRYLITKENALVVFKKLAVGIKNSDLVKLPLSADSINPNQDSDQDGYNDAHELKYNYNPYNNKPVKISIDKKFAEKLKGKLLLQVEGGGAIWYVDQNNMVHNLRNDNLLTELRKIAVGISDSDLQTIEVGY